jgi:hypothetical protein
MIVSALTLSPLRTRLPWRVRLSTAWFGPTGFASVAHGQPAPPSGSADAQLVFDPATTRP